MEAVKCDLIRELFAVLAKRCRFSETDILVPFHKADAAECIFYCHIQGIIIQPIGIVRDELLIFRCIHKSLFFRILKCDLQDFEPGQIDFLIVHVMFIVSEVITVTDLLRQKPFFDQNLQIDIVRVPRKSGKRLIRRVSVSGRSERQDLPQPVAGLLQKIHKTIAFPAKGSDPICGRDTGYRQ